MNFKDKLQNKIFSIVGQVADIQGVEAFVIGGWVRDLILERRSDDIDFAVHGSGIELAKNVSKKIKNSTFSYFNNFGTAMISANIDGELYKLEFVGTRKESYRRNSRKPIVENGSIADDQNRRDFTINALAIQLNASHFGELIDPFNGVQDIEDKIIKTPLEPEITFSDDPLRMIRAIRFACQLNFEITPKTFDAIKTQSYRISIVSQERISEELNKILMSKKPSKGFILLEESGILQLIFPELTALKGVETIGKNSHKDNFYHTLKVVDNISEHTDNLWLRWAALLHDIAKSTTKKYIQKIGWTFHGHEFFGAKMIPQIFQRMKLPTHETMHYVQKLVNLHLRPISLVEDKVTDSAIRRLLFEAGDDIDDLMTLCHADITSKNSRKVSRFHNNFDLVKQKLIEIEQHDKLRNWQPPISGELIIETFNIQPSAEVGKIKNLIREAILDGKLENDFESAFQFMLKIGDEMGLIAKKLK